MAELTKGLAEEQPQRPSGSAGISGGVQGELLGQVLTALGIPTMAAREQRESFALADSQHKINMGIEPNKDLVGILPKEVQASIKQTVGSPEFAHLKAQTQEHMMNADAVETLYKHADPQRLAAIIQAMHAMTPTQEQISGALQPMSPDTGIDRQGPEAAVARSMLPASLIQYADPNQAAIKLQEQTQGVQRESIAENERASQRTATAADVMHQDRQAQLQFDVANANQLDNQHTMTFMQNALQFMDPPDAAKYVSRIQQSMRSNKGLIKPELFTDLAGAIRKTNPDLSASLKADQAWRDKAALAMPGIVKKLKSDGSDTDQNTVNATLMPLFNQHIEHSVALAQGLGSDMAANAVENSMPMPIGEDGSLYGKNWSIRTANELPDQAAKLAYHNQVKQMVEERMGKLGITGGAADAMANDLFNRITGKGAQAAPGQPGQAAPAAETAPPAPVPFVPTQRLIQSGVDKQGKPVYRPRTIDKTSPTARQRAR